MATVLQQQLAAISAKSTDQLNLKAQKQRHSKSLLFEPREASGQSFDTLYQICSEGFDDLCQLDGRFQTFATNLFAPTSIDVEREQLTAKENADLDGVVDKFMGLVCGRLLLRPAQKSVEWLVRRWKAQEYNVSTLLLAFLPYHGHDIFPTLLSILPQQLPPTFNFLRPYVAALQCPPRHAVVAAAINTPAFLSDLSSFVVKTAKRKHHSGVLVGFWASVTAQAVNGLLDHSQSGRPDVRRQKTEDVLLRVLPFLQDALSIHHAPELYMAVCMVMTILATKAQLDDRVLDAMMEAIAGAWTQETLEDGLLCLSVLAEDKAGLDQAPAVSKAILGSDDAVETLSALSARHRTGKLALGLVLSTSNSTKSSTSAETLLSLCDNGGLEKHYEALGRQLFTSLASSSTPEGIKSKQRAVLQHLLNKPTVSSVLERVAKETGQQLESLELTASAAHQIEDYTPMEVDEPVAESTNASIDLEQVLKALPKVPKLGFSFAASDADVAITQAYIDAFTTAGSDQTRIESLIVLPSLQRKRADKSPEFLTFLAATWTSARTATARSKALEDAAGSVSKLPLDFQNLLPFVLAALGDGSQIVRKAAGRLAIAISEQYGSGKKSSKVEEWCKGSVYGSAASGIHTLATDDTKKFLDSAVLPVLEDCVLDATFVSRHIVDQLNGSDLKSALRANVCSWLASHALASGIAPVKLSLLGLLSRTGKIASQARGKTIAPFVSQLASEKTTASKAVEQAVLRTLSHRTSEEVNALEQAAQTGRDDLADMAFKRLSNIFENMKPQLQSFVADALLAQSLEATSDDRQASALEALRNAAISPEVLAHLLDSLPSATSVSDGEQERPSKRQRTSKSAATPEKPKPIDRAKLDNALRRMTRVLELVEAATASQSATKSSEGLPQLLKGLFHLLGELHKWRAIADSDLVYVQALLLGDLLGVVQGLDAEAATKIDRSIIRTDLIVEALRSTSSPQVHNTALLLISKLASLVPDTVLHSVMPLFTFMSSNTLRQADNYSNHVVSMTVESIVPPLAASLRKKGRDLVSGAAELLLSFTAAFEHMPLHRRQGTFQHLVQTLGPDDVLFAVIAMLVERYPSDNGLPAFIRDLCNGCSVSTQLGATRQYLDLVVESCTLKRPLADTVLGFGEKNAEQAKASVAVLLEGLPIVLENSGFRRKLASDMQKSDEKAESVRTLYGHILERIVSFPKLPTTKGGIDVGKDARILAANDRALEALLTLMPTEDFINASASLMQAGSEQTRTQVFASLTKRVGEAKQSNTSLRKVFIDALPNCTVFLHSMHPVAVRQAAIECVDGIVEKYGRLDRAVCASAAEAVAGDAALRSDSSALRIASILCLASMVEHLGEELLGIVPSIANTTLTYAEGHPEDSKMKNAIFSFLNALLDSMPFVLSGAYLDRAVITASKSVANGAERSWAVAQFASLAAKKVAFAELVASLGSVWDTVAAAGADAAALCVEMLQAGIKQNTKATVTKSASVLFPVMLKTFDLRRSLDESTEEDEEDDKAPIVYAQTCQTAMDMVLKLNDATFRPFFIKLIAWAADELPKSDAEGRTKRGIALYEFAYALFQQLGSLVTSYSSFMLENAVTVLRSAQKQTHPELVEAVLRAMSSSFRHDESEGGFWSAPQHFDAIREPLVSLLAVTSIPSTSTISSITALAAAVSQSADHLKALNTNFTRFIRHQDPAVRLAAVQTQRSITDELKFDWLNLLPEMLPVIAELLEDSDEGVERETVAWTRGIEAVTGEDLEGMLA